MAFSPFSRRHLLARGAAFSAGFAGFRTLMGSSGSSMAVAAERLRDGVAADGVGYGPLVEDPHRIIDLPAGFTYRVIGKRGDVMSDGLFLPGHPDAMAAFPGPDADTTIIIRNHELPIDANRLSAFGPKLELLAKVAPERMYDRGEGKTPACGGTTTLVYDTRGQRVVKQFLSLAGTTQNCAGGMTPWGTWLSCEEDTTTPGKGAEKLHGYVFEVPASTAMEVTIPKPIKAMGRFRHEACAIDPASGVVCIPNNYDYGPERSLDEGWLRVTALAAHDPWCALPEDEYRSAKTEWFGRLNRTARRHLPPVADAAHDAALLSTDMFTPRTVRKFTGHAGGAIYGSTVKRRDGRTDLANLFLIGTDQGFLGVTGAMLSGISMANLHGLKA